MADLTIKLKIEQEDDLFSPFDPDKELISEDVSEYLLNSFQRKRKSVKDTCVIRIISDAPLDKENVKKRLRDHFSGEIAEVKRSLKKLSIKTICLAVFGLIVLSLMFWLSANSDSMFLEILDIIAWVSIWEATSIIVIQSYDFRKAKRDYKKLTEATIEISDQGE